MALSSAYVAASQPTPHVPTPETSESNSNEEQRGTEKLPMVVNIQSIPPPTKEEKAQQAEDRREKFETDRWLIELNGGLVVATVALFIATLLLWRSTRRLVIDAGAAAAATVNALQATERAYLFVEFPSNVAPLTNSSVGIQNIFDVVIWNHGKTPAEVILIRGYPLVQDSIPQALIDFEGSELELPPGLGIATNCSYPIPISHRLTDTERSDIEGWNSKLFIVGCISYRDIFGEVRETGFCWEFLSHMGNQRFIPTRTSLLNKRT